MGISVQLGALPYCILCEQYYAIKQLIQNTHKVALLTLGMVNKNNFTANKSMQKKIYEGQSVSPYLLAKTLFWHLPDQTT
jgi:hypothetical protein